MNRYRFQLIFFVLVSLSSLKGNTQSNDFFTLKGKVVDSSNNEPLPFAHIQIKNSGNGTVTNKDGEFSFKMPKGRVNTNLVISFIGYEPYELAITSDVDGYLFIPLKSNLIELDEVEVRPFDAVRLLKRAVEKIPQNHSPDSVLSTAYFRYFVMQDSLPLYMEEYVFESYKDQYSKTEQWNKLKGRYIRDEEMLAIPGNTRFKTGLPNLLHGVNIFTTYPFRDGRSIISKKDYSNYEFELEEITTYKGRDIYVIGFDQKPEIKESLYKGKIYIDEETLGFLRIQSEVSPRGKKYISKSGRYGGPYWVLEEDNEVNYKIVDGKWYLSDISFYLKAENFQRNYITELSADCIITDIKTENITPIVTDKRKLKKGFKEINKGSAEPWDLRNKHTFWDSYNFMQLSNDWVKMAEDLFIKNQKWKANSKDKNIEIQLNEDESFALDLMIQKAHNRGLFDGNVLIARGGATVYDGGFGFADIKNQALNSSTKPYPIFSVSKPFTAIRIFQLIEAGKINLDDKVMQHFTHHQIPQIDSVTIGHLLSHSSGIPDFINNNSVSIGEQLTEEIFMQKLEKVFLDFEPGTQFSYANSTYILLSFLIERIAKASFAKNIKENITDVANMQYTGTKTRGVKIKNMAKNYVKMKDKIIPMGDGEDMGLYKGAGAIYASSEDLLKWGNMLFTDKLLNEESKQKMWLPTELQSRYAYGWSVFEIPGVGVFRGHLGGMGESLRTVVLQEVHNEYFVVINSNTGLDFETMDLLVNNIFKVLTKGKSPNFSLDELTALE